MRLVAQLMLVVWLTAAGLLAAPAALCVPGGDFAVAEFANAWEFTSPRPGMPPPLTAEAGRGLVFAPELKSGERALLVSKTPLMLLPYHRYRLTLDVRGALFIRWQAAVLLDAGDGTRVRQPLFPLVAYHTIAPPPVWETRTFEFIAPNGFVAARFEFVWDALAVIGQNPGLANVRVSDLGAVANSAAAGTLIVRFNAGFEELAAEDGAAPGWGAGKVVCDPTTAHTGRQFLRIATNLATLDFGGVGLSSRPLPVVLRVSLWAKGQGRLSFGALLSQPPPYWRLQNLESPAWPLTDSWARYSWDFVLAPQDPLPGDISFNLRLSGKQLDLDDVELRVLPPRSR